MLSTVVTAGWRYGPCRLSDNNNNNNCHWWRGEEFACELDDGGEWRNQWRESLKDYLAISIIFRYFTILLQHKYLLLRVSLSADIKDTLFSTHVQLTPLACVWPTNQSVSEASHTDHNTRTSRQRPAEWKLDAQNYWTCHACMDDLCHQSQSLSDTAWGTSSSVLSPTSPQEDHTASSTVTTSFAFHLLLSRYFITDFIHHSLYTKYLYVTAVIQW